MQIALATHRARNVELLREMTTKGIKLTEKRLFDVKFCASDQQDAALLARELFRMRFFVKLLCLSGERRWIVEADALVPPSEMLGDQLTEQLVRLATNCAAVYDGWGTEVDFPHG
jgi:hypothetical protein